MAPSLSKVTHWTNKSCHKHTEHKLRSDNAKTLLSNTSRSWYNYSKYGNIITWHMRWYIHLQLPPCEGGPCPRPPPPPPPHSSPCPSPWHSWPCQKAWYTGPRSVRNDVIITSHHKGAWHCELTWVVVVVGMLEKYRVFASLSQSWHQWNTVKNSECLAS